MKNIYLPNLVIKNSELTPSQKKVAYHLFYISSFAEQEHYLPTKASLAKTLNTTRPTISAAYKKLEELGFLVIKDETFNFYLESREFHTEDLRNSKLCEMVGHFTRIPQSILYNPELTPAQLDTFIKFFGRNFKFENYATKIIPIGSSITSASIIAKEYNDNEQAFSKNIRFLKEHQFIDYDYCYRDCKKIFSFCKILEKAWKEIPEKTIPVVEAAKETVLEEAKIEVPVVEQLKKKYEEALKKIEQLEKENEQLKKKANSEKAKIEVPVEDSIAEETTEKNNFVGTNKMIDFLNSTSIVEDSIEEPAKETIVEENTAIEEKEPAKEDSKDIGLADFLNSTIIETTKEDFSKTLENFLKL